jgi:hypothetical protein
VQVFALYHPADGRAAVPDSLGLSKGLVAITHLYADTGAQGSNQLVVAHELLHTLGATDKYDRATGQPLELDGLGDPGQSPRYPQQFGEIMAGRVATNVRDALEAGIEIAAHGVPRQLISVAVAAPTTTSSSESGISASSAATATRPAMISAASCGYLGCAAGSA